MNCVHVCVGLHVRDTRVRKVLTACVMQVVDKLGRNNCDRVLLCQSCLTIRDVKCQLHAELLYVGWCQ